MLKFKKKQKNNNKYMWKQKPIFSIEDIENMALGCRLNISPLNLYNDYMKKM